MRIMTIVMIYSIIYNWEIDQVGGGVDDENDNGDCGDLQHGLQLGE